MTWSCTASHFFGGICGPYTTLLWTIFLCLTTLLWTNLFEPENAQTRRKHEKKTKKTRKKHEVLRVFRPLKEKIIGLKQPVDRCKKISGLNWTTEKQRVKMTRWNQLVKIAKWSKVGLVENQPHHFVPRWREVTNFIAGCDEVALKSATS